MTEGTDIKINGYLDITKVNISSEALGSAISQAYNAYSSVSSLLKGGGSSGFGSYNQFAKTLAANRGQDPNDSGFDETQIAVLKALRGISDGLKKMSTSIVGFMQMGFGFVEDIYKQMKRSSPLLEMIENLFNLAVTLFFMPLGNKLGEMLIPAVMDMMDAVLEMWEAFDDMTLGEMFSMALEKGIEIISDLLNDMGNILASEEGIVGDIGRLLIGLSTFLETSGESLLNFAMDILSFMMEHLGTFIGLAVGFFVASLAIQTGIYSYLLSGIFKDLGLGTAAGIMSAAAVLSGGTAVIGGISAGVWAGSMVPTMATGGYVPATTGGQLVVLGEGGEGEYVIPESKMGSAMGMSATYNFYGLTNSELQSTIRGTVNEMISESKYKGGF